MVAYSFKPAFCGPIRQRTKRQTIRLPRKRRGLVGDPLQFFTGPRMKPTRVGYAVCDGVHDVRLDLDLDVVTLDDAISFTDVESLDRFATADGFGFFPVGSGTPWKRMKRWRALTHPDHPVFRGVMITWGDSFTEERPA